MKRTLLCILLCALSYSNTLAQETKPPLSPEEVKRFVEKASAEQKLVTITLKTPNVARVGEHCTDYPQKLSVKVVNVADASFWVENREAFMGDIAAAIEYENVASIKIQNKAWRNFVKTTRATGMVTATIAALPVFLGGMAVCAASGGKHGRWACPR